MVEMGVETASKGDQRGEQVQANANVIPLTNVQVGFSTSAINCTVAADPVQVCSSSGKRKGGKSKLMARQQRG